MSRTMDKRPLTKSLGVESQVMEKQESIRGEQGYLGSISAALGGQDLTCIPKIRADCNLMMQTCSPMVKNCGQTPSILKKINMLCGTSDCRDRNSQLVPRIIFAHES